MAEFPRMLTLKQCSKETGLSYEYLRKLCLQNEIVYVKTGTKYLINADKLADYFNGKEDNLCSKT